MWKVTDDTNERIYEAETDSRHSEHICGCQRGAGWERDWEFRVSRQTIIQTVDKE